jgi:hypothetical protein
MNRRHLPQHSAHTYVRDERGLAPDHEFLIPGQGETDYVRYLRAMRQASYDGHIVVEISLMVQRRPGYDPIAAASQSYEVLARVFADAGIARASRSDGPWRTRFVRGRQPSRFSRSRAHPFMQNRMPPASRGPSGKTWPR